MAGWTGLEPATSCVTGRRSNRLNYHPIWEKASKEILVISYQEMAAGAGIKNAFAQHN